MTDDAMTVVLAGVLGVVVAVWWLWLLVRFIDHARDRWVWRTLNEPTGKGDPHARKVERALALIWRCSECGEQTAGRFRCVNCRAWRS